MSKPINVEAQRVSKVLTDLSKKIEVVSYLTTECVQNMTSQDVDLEDMFGKELADLLLVHGELERSFKENNLTLDQKILADDDEQMTDEHRTTAARLKKTTSKLVRLLMNDDDSILKLRRFSDHSKNLEMDEYLKTISNLKKLWSQKLATSLEEKEAKEASIEELSNKNAKLKENYINLRDSYQKFKQETDDKREQLEKEKSTLQSELSTQSVEKNRREAEIKENNTNEMEQNQTNHEQLMENLQKKHEELTNKLTVLKIENSKDEDKLHKEFKRAETTLESNIEGYDQEMQEKNETLNKAKQDYNEVQEQLAIVENMYRGKMEEKKRKQEEEERMKKKQQERDQQLNTLNKAAEWVQAHYRGLITRRAYNKKKGKKGKKKKKK